MRASSTLPCRSGQDSRLGWNSLARLLAAISTEQKAEFPSQSETAFAVTSAFLAACLLTRKAQVLQSGIFLSHARGFANVRLRQRGRCALCICFGAPQLNVGASRSSG